MWPYTRSGVQFHHLVLMDKNINEANWDLDIAKRFLLRLFYMLKERNTERGVISSFSDKGRRLRFLHECDSDGPENTTIFLESQECWRSTALRTISLLHTCKHI